MLAAIINGLAEALLTTPEWLTDLSDDKEYDSYTPCQKDIEQHIKKYLDTQDVPDDYKEISFVCLRSDGFLELPSTVGIACRPARKKVLH